ncbi:MAG: MarR family winged helix-turn-helix transcriptional regulator [Solirubrobacteraceae bacterium]
MSNASSDPPPGFELPLLLLLGFRGLIDELHTRLGAAGYPETRPLHGFVLQAVGPQGATAVMLGQRLGISKQAAGKLVAGLEQLGYVTREIDQSDARRKLVRISPRGADLLAQSARIFDELRGEWAATLGEERLRALENDLRRATAGTPGRLLEIPGWFARS